VIDGPETDFHLRRAREINLCLPSPLPSTPVHGDFYLNRGAVFRDDARRLNGFRLSRSDGISNAVVKGRVGGDDCAANVTFYLAAR